MEEESSVISTWPKNHGTEYHISLVHLGKATYQQMNESVMGYRPELCTGVSIQPFEFFLLWMSRSLAVANNVGAKRSALYVR
jgi:hypothetical protein